MEFVKSLRGSDTERPWITALTVEVCFQSHGCCWPCHAIWRRHQMETFSAFLALCAGNSPVTGDLPSKKLVTWRFDVFFDLCLNKRLSQQSRGWWFETPMRSLWHCNDQHLNYCRTISPAPLSPWWHKSHGNDFCITDPLWGESASNWWIPLTNVQ